MVIVVIVVCLFILFVSPPPPPTLHVPCASCIDCPSLDRGDLYLHIACNQGLVLSLHTGVCISRYRNFFIYESLGVA